MSPRRRVDPTVAVARAQQHAESYDNAAPRRPINGHTPDCPNRTKGPMRRCRHCRAEQLERDRLPDSRALTGDNGRPQQRDPLSATLRPQDPPTHGSLRIRPENPPTTTLDAPLAACRVCFAPTTDPEGHCA